MRSGAAADGQEAAEDADIEAEDYISSKPTPDDVDAALATQHEQREAQRREAMLNHQ